MLDIKLVIAQSVVPQPATTAVARVMSAENVSPQPSQRLATSATKKVIWLVTAPTSNLVDQVVSAVASQVVLVVVRNATSVARLDTLLATAIRAVSVAAMAVAMVAAAVAVAVVRPAIPAVVSATWLVTALKDRSVTTVSVLSIAKRIFCC